MNKKLLIRVIITWLLFLPIPIINGLLREFWYKEYLGALLAGQIGCIILSLIFLFYAKLSLKPHIDKINKKQLIIIGSFWLLLTLIFEFGLGLAAGRSWSYLLADYKVWEGRIWPLVLLTVFFSPLIIRKIYKKEL
jgi:hypothetical protein